MEWDGDIFLLTLFACPIGCLTTFTVADGFNRGFTKTGPASITCSAFDARAMRGTIISCLNAYILIFVADSEYTVLILCSGKQRGRMFVTKWGLPLTSHKCRQGILMRCGGYGGYCYDML